MKFIARCRSDKVLRLRAQYWFFIANVPIVLAVYWFAPPFYEKASVLYLLLLSLWTQIETIDGAIEAAEANEKS